MDFIKLMNERRSVNYFDKNKKLGNDLLKKIIDLAVLAPSAFNLQPWRIIIVKSETSKKKLYQLSNQQIKVLEASANALIIGKKDAWSESNPVWNEMLNTFGNKDIVEKSKKAAEFLYGETEEKKIKFAVSNASLLAMSIMLAAKEYGVDTHPMSGIDVDGIHKEFELKHDEVVVMNIAMGYFDKNKILYSRRPRIMFENVVTIV
ncbi:MAG TPA: nitroreductase family protein [Bacteroidales bacterium]|nr:nitroreductase family protein [Bacteroidales bacterium]